MISLLLALSLVIGGPDLAAKEPDQNKLHIFRPIIGPSVALLVADVPLRVRGAPRALHLAQIWTKKYATYFDQAPKPAKKPSIKTKKKKTRAGKPRRTQAQVEFLLPPPEPTLLPDGTILLKEELAQKQEFRQPVMGSCDQNPYGDEWCHAYCDVRVRKTYERTFRIVNREQFISHHVSAAAQNEEAMEILLGIISFGLGNIAEIFKNENRISQTKKICETLPEVFTIRKTEESQNYKRHPAKINPQYFQELASEICQKEPDYLAPIIPPPQP